MLAARIKCWRRVELIDLTIDACADEALRLQIAQHALMFAFAVLDEWCEQQDRRPLLKPQYLVDHLADRLRFE